MSQLENLRQEIRAGKPGRLARDIFYADGFLAHRDEENVIARAYACASVFRLHEKHIYDSDMIAGSIRGLFSDDWTEDDHRFAGKILSSYGFRGFWENADHFAPDYAGFLKNGVGGTLRNIEDSMTQHRQDADAVDKLNFLRAAKITMKAFSAMIQAYADAAAEKAGQTANTSIRSRLLEVAETCRAVTEDAPKTFRQALQLVWLCHVSFVCEGRYAMALGRMDQYLYPYFRADIESGSITHAQALEWIECTLLKIHELAAFAGGDDVVNIAIGGVKPENGEDAVNDLSYLILQAVGRCNVPGPNLSARLHSGISSDFLDACLQVIGTGLGYPALMNDDVNIPALNRYGYALEDCRNYCMVGCIENFIQGMQPPWSDGRYNTPKYLELALNNGYCMMTGERRGPQTGEPSAFQTMDQFMEALEEQMRFGASEYMMLFRNANERPNPLNYQQPYLSCYCRDCIARGLDINRGGAKYPSVHGACGMGIATMADSLAAIEKLVYEDQVMTLTEMRNILRDNFEGHETERVQMLKAPKYGNNNDYADKYAVWFVNKQEEIFSAYRTHDGGRIYTLIASNVANIPAGQEIAATPDGRGKGEPVSDAASPMHGMDTHGPTAAALSLAKPDYTLAAGGTVVNQKYSPEMFREPEKRKKLAAMIRTYFEMGGQEVQINSVSRGVLKDAMVHPENYKNLVVRVSGFSAYYTLLNRAVQEDILKRTEHE